MARAGGSANPARHASIVGMSRRWFGLALAGLLVAPLFGSGPGAAEVAAGTGVSTSWLSGLKIHNKGSFPDQRVRLPASHAATTYLLGGIDGGGWVLLDARGSHTALYALRNGGPHKFRSVDDSEDGHSFLLAPDGRSVVEVDAPTTVHTEVYTYGVSGQRVRHRGFGGYWELLAYDGETVWLTKGRHTRAWTPGSAPVEVGTLGSVAADPEQDLLFTYDDGMVGPTSLAAPTTPVWTVPSSFTPKRVSPDGVYVAGFGERSNSLEVRRMSDGSLVSEWTVHLAFDRPLLWDGDSSDRLVSVLRTRRGWAVLRCDVGGDCVRSTALVGDHISLPDQLVSPGL